MSRALSSRPSSLACPPRFGTERDLSCATHGDRVADFAKSLGMPLMPWQQHVADVALEVDPATGRLKYRRVILTVPRQSGKTTLILALFAHRALGFGSRQVMTYAAQTGVDARKKFIDEHVPLLEGSLLKPLFRVRKTNGHEAVLWQNGSRHHISAGTEKSGHGATLDLAVVDEAFAQPDGRLEQAFSPAMVTRPEPQLWSVSTAGKPTDEWFFAKIKAGRALADGSDGTAYFEWSAPTDADPHDPAVWASCMPALGHTVTEDVVRAELAAFEAEDKVGEFRRAYLNQWVQQEASSVVDLDAWNLRRTKHHEPVRPVFSVEVATDRSTATIGAAWRVDGTPHVEIVEDRPGTEWVPARIDELRSKYGYSNVVVDASSEAASLVPALEALGLTVVKVGGAERAAACGSFYDLVTSARLTHNGDPAVLAALGMARWRDVGEGARVFSRRRSGGDIAALYAVALALHGLMVAPPPREFWGAIA